MGFFAQMKGAWRKQLRDYKQRDPTAALINGLDPQAHLPSTFRMCGFYPLNRQEVLNRITSIMDSQAIERNLDDTLLKTLELRRFRDQSKKPRGQKIPAGQSYSAQDSEEEDSKEEDNVEESTEEETSEEEDSRQEKEEGSRHEELEDEELPEPHPGASSPKF